MVGNGSNVVASFLYNFKAACDVFETSTDS
jgi:hypothetical protein